MEDEARPTNPHELSSKQGSHRMPFSMSQVRCLSRTNSLRGYQSPFSHQHLQQAIANGRFGAHWGTRPGHDV